MARDQRLKDPTETKDRRDGVAHVTAGWRLKGGRMASREQEITDLLTKILRVLALQVSSSSSVTEGARALKLAGLDNQMVAEVLNTSPATVRTLTANLRTRNRRLRTSGR
jgi:hypothetical protein